MRRQLFLVLTLAAWLLATGHWDLVHTFAWRRMITSYSQSMPLLRAVEKTFTGDALGRVGLNTAFVSPGVTVEVTSRSHAFVFVQLPVYQRVNGLQLHPRWLLSPASAINCRFRTHRFETRLAE